MEFHEFLNLIARKRKTIYGIVALFIVLSAGIIAVQRFKYSSKSQLLVVQEYNSTVDAYNASKSTERLSSVLANVVTSNSFFSKVLAASPTINVSYFGTTPKDQMKQWDRTVTAKSINDAGIIAVTVYHPDRAEAEKIAGAINYVLMTQHSAYDGANDAVKIRLIDQPVSSSFPVQPNIPLILGLAIALGFVSSLIYVYLSPTHPVASPAKALTFEDVIHTNAPRLQAHQAPTDPHHHGVEVRGQLPEEAVANLSFEEVLYPEESSPYGHHARIHHDAPHEQGFNQPFPATDPEELIRQGSMRNVLS